ncbi:hypothetical protein ABK046_46080, partial [Streptomyces caeruleatus]
MAINFQLAGQFDVTATCDYTVNYTDGNVDGGGTILSTVWSAGLTGATTDQVGSILFPVAASR